MKKNPERMDCNLCGRGKLRYPIKHKGFFFCGSDCARGFDRLFLKTAPLRSRRGF